MKSTIEEIRDKVWHIKFDNQYDLTSSFMRVQEFYESPFPFIRNKFFKHEQFMDKYAKVNGSFSYYEDWSGFNLNSDIIKKFWGMFRFDLWRKEEDLFNQIFSIPNYSEDFYIIGTYNKDIEHSVSIQHELAHAYWYLHDDYYKKMGLMIHDNLTKINKNIIPSEILISALEKMGYSLSVSKDEIQAYLATSSRRDLIETLGDEISNLRIPTCFSTYFKEFDKQQKGVVDEGKTNSGEQT